MALISTGKRRHDDGLGLNNMIVLSILLHALVLSIMLFSPSWPTPKWTFGPVYTVDLVSIPLGTVEASYNRPISREIIGINSGGYTSVIKKNTDSIRPISIKEPKTRKIEPTGEVNKAIEGIKERVISSQESASPASPGVASQGHVEMNMKMRVYYSLVWSKVRENWALPEGILHDDNLVAVIGVKILRNGNVAEIDFEKKSGNRYFDESAVKAIRKAGPFPPLPDWVNESYIEVGVRFHSSDLR
ncbi:MAG: TonB C-terminal domain-containing protein [Syntrophobacterales bacterium]|nr:MAG: TonB C-terminal domain-containing protein [Syntrophobacterales bacterium]